MTMSIEEKIDLETWEVLKQLKGDFVITPKNEPTVYEIHFGKTKTNYPSPERQIKILHLIKKMGVFNMNIQDFVGIKGSAINIVNDALQSSGEKPKSFRLNINKNKFNRLFSKYEQNEKNYIGIIKIKLKNGKLTLNTHTGLVKLNKTSSVLNPKSKEFTTLIKLATGKDFVAKYNDLLNNEVSKASKMDLALVIRNIKETIGILPIKNSKNKDIIKNIKGYGYKLIT